MTTVDQSLRFASRRATGARLARALIVLGVSIWVGGTLANIFFAALESLFNVAMIGAGMTAAGVVMRGLQIILPRRQPFWAKSLALCVLVTFGWGLFFALALLAAVPFGDASPFLIEGK